jgi:hypothetical protein
VTIVMTAVGLGGTIVVVSVVGSGGMSGRGTTVGLGGMSVGIRVGVGLFGPVGLGEASVLRSGGMTGETRVGVRPGMRVGVPEVGTSVVDSRVATSGAGPVGVTSGVGPVGVMSGGVGLVGRIVRRGLGRGAMIRRFRKGSRVPNSTVG